MLYEDNPFLCQHVGPQDVVSIPVPLYESKLGNYFVGQTCPLTVQDHSYAWAGLVNPHCSCKDLYVNVFTITNFSDDYLTAEIWLNVDFPNTAAVSSRVSPTNTALDPLPRNNVEITFVDSTSRIPTKGINIYDRIVPPKTTLVGEEDGKFIVPPCGNYTVVIKSSSSIADKVIVAFGWWEQ